MQIRITNREFSNGTPARVNRATGVVELAPSFFSHNADERAFILNHEMGHYVLQTKQEKKADIYAANNLYKIIGLKRTADAINYSLHDSLLNDQRRLNVFNYLAKKDRDENGNNIMDLTIKDLTYNDMNGDMVVFDGFVNEDGLEYTNTFVADCGNINELELSDYLNFCEFYGIEPSAEAVQVFREQKLRDVGKISNMSESRMSAQETQDRALQLLEQGRITTKQYNELVSGIDTRSGFQKLLDELSPAKILGNAGERESRSSTSGSAMLPVAVILIAIAVIVIFLSYKN